jgi:hypothetical protein
MLCRYNLIVCELKKDLKSEVMLLSMKAGGVI